MAGNCTRAGADSCVALLIASPQLFVFTAGHLPPTCVLYCLFSSPIATASFHARSSRADVTSRAAEALGCTTTIRARPAAGMTQASTARD